MKLSNTVLIAIFLALAGIMAWINFSDSKTEKRNFRKELVSIDTSKITELLLYPQALQGKEIKFTKQSDGWILSSTDTSATLGKPAVEPLINNLLQVKPKRLAARSEAKWQELEVDEAKATRIKVKEGSETTLDLFVGKFTFQQAEGQTKANPNMPPQQQQPIMTSFVRLAGDVDVYAVDGILSMMYNRQVADFLPKPTPPVETETIKGK